MLLCRVSAELHAVAARRRTTLAGAYTQQCRRFVERRSSLLAVIVAREAPGEAAAHAAREPCLCMAQLECSGGVALGRFVRLRSTAILLIAGHVQRCDPDVLVALDSQGTGEQA
jgi:hypothetical protein